DQLRLHVSASLAGVLMPLLARVRSQFDLDANPAVIAAHLAQDAGLAPQIAAQAGLRVPGAFEPFELAIRAILGQQVSVAGATTISGRLLARFGEPAATPFAAVTRHFPRPQQLAQAEVGDVAQLGMPQTRAQTIIDFARFTADGGLNIRPGTGLDAAVAQLKTVRGIGDWTAHYIALRALRFPDAFPAGDLGLQKAAALIDAAPERLTEKQLHARAQDWAPWRGYAALALWHALA
ncbi:DNA-3-methyladenine glycosylase family protein, partial [Undibacterium arcticum]